MKRNHNLCLSKLIDMSAHDFQNSLNCQTTQFAFSDPFIDVSSEVMDNTAALKKLQMALQHWLSAAHSAQDQVETSLLFVNPFAAHCEDCV